MRGMKCFTAILYYLTSMLPAWLFLIISISANEQIGVLNNYKNVLVILIIFSIVFSLLLWFLTIRFNHNSISEFYFDPKHITTINDGYANFIISFTAPNFIVNNNIDNIYIILVIHLIYHVIIFVLYYNSSAIIPNIMLFFIGYQLYNFENMYWILTKEKSLRNHIGKINTKRISNYLYIKTDEGEDV